MTNEPIVTIYCLTYNHESYIADALEGFMAQKVDFPIECLVVNDCSTDGTLQVVRTYQEKYPGKIRVIMPPQNTRGKIGKEVYPQFHGKYIALCEGDDYWVDEHKLQKQVDYMEEHPTCACCCCNSFYLDQNNLEESRKEKKVMGPVEDMDHLDVQSYLENEEYVGGSATMLYRNYHEKLPTWVNRFDFGDLTRFLQAFKHGYVHYSGEVRAIYRINVPGSYNGRINALKPEERASKRLRYWEDVCAVWQYFNIDTGYRWDEAIQKGIRNIRNRYIAKEYGNLRIAKTVDGRSWKGILPVINSILKVASMNKKKRQIAIWGMGKVGSELTNELADKVHECRLVDQRKKGAKRPEELFVLGDKSFVIVTMMKGYEEVEKQLRKNGYNEWVDYICLAKFKEIYLHYCIWELI